MIERTGNGAIACDTSSRLPLCHESAARRLRRPVLRMLILERIGKEFGKLIARLLGMLKGADDVGRSLDITLRISHSHTLRNPPYALKSVSVSPDIARAPARR